MAEPISSRSSQLTKTLLGKTNGKSAFNLSREGLIDAFLALYDDCNNDCLKKDRNVAKFLDKFREAVAEVRRLQVNMGDFEVKKVIGQGHFGEVMLVREKETTNIYAMKKISKDKTNDKQMDDFYERERDIMMKAAGPWLTHLRYSFHDSKFLYLVMEYHPGGDMLSLMERNEELLPESDAQFYLAELILAVRSLHAMGYVHRDIKPDNILLDCTGHIKLADFGSASSLDDQQLVRSKFPVGTPEYIAPEVLSSINGSSKPYGTGCDWWSVGVVFYEMLYGSTPFGTQTVMDTYYNIINFKATLSIPEGLSEGARDILKGLLTDEQSRFGYKELNQHRYLEGINWTGIREGQAPYIPNISGQDDTSHFDEIQHEPTPPSIEQFRHKRDFSGKNLPFVGFTYNSHLSAGFSSRTSLAFCISPGGVGPTSEAHSAEHLLYLTKKDFVELQRKHRAQSACEAALRSQLAFAQDKASALEKRASALDRELGSLRLQLVEKDKETQSARRHLDLEKQHRVVSEKKAMALGKDLRRRYEDCDNLKNELKEESIASDDDSTLKEEHVTVVLTTSDDKECGSSVGDVATQSQARADALLEVEAQWKMERLALESQIQDLQLKLKTQICKQGCDVEVQTGFQKAEAKALEIELRNTTQRFEESQESYLRAVQDISQLKSKVEAKTREVQRLFAEVGNCRETEVQLRDQIKDGEKELKLMLNEQKKKAEDLEMSLGTEKRLRQEAERRLEENKSSLQHAIKSLEKNLQETLTTKKKEEREVARLQKTNAHDRETIVQLQKDLQASVLQRSEEAASTAQSVCCGECKIVSEKLSRSRERIKNLHNDQSSRCLELFDLQQALRTTECNLEQVKSELSLALKDLESSRATSKENEGVREKLACLVQVHAHCSTKEAALQEKIDALAAKLDIQKQLQWDVDSKLSQLDDKLLEVVAQKNQLEKDYSFLSKRFDVLSKASLQTEEQVKVYETLFLEKDRTETALLSEIHGLKLELEAKMKEVALLQTILEKDRKKHCEEVGKHSRQLEEERSRMKDSSQEVTSLRAKLCRKEKLEQDLRRQVDLAEEHYQKLAMDKIRGEQLLENAEFQVIKIKEEASRHITALASLRRSVEDLQESLESKENQLRVSSCEMESLQSDLDMQKVYYETELTRCKEQNHQLMQLVSHLQNCMSDKKRKWPFSFKSKVNTSSAKKENRRSQLWRMEKEMHDMHKKQGQLDTPSKTSEDSSETGSVSSKGSHAFSEVTKGSGFSACSVCGKASPATDMLACHDCGVTCHRQCEGEVVGDCNFHSETLRRRRTIRRQMTFHVQRGEYGAWVCIPRRRNAGWERRYLLLRNGALHVHQTSETPSTAVTTFELCPQRDDAVIVVKESLSDSLILEVFSLGTPSREMSFMVDDVDEKFKWLEVLEGVIRPRLAKMNKILDISALDSCIFTLEKENLLELKCAYALPNGQQLLLGAEEGLFWLDLRGQPGSSLRRRDNDSVHSMADMLNHMILILVQGTDRSARWALTSMLIKGSETAFPLIHGLLTDCRVVASCDQTVGVATSRAIYLLLWNQQKGDFTLHKEVPTPQYPCIAMEMNQTVLLYATNTLRTLVLDVHSNVEATATCAVALFAEGLLQKQRDPTAIYAVGEAFLVCMPAFEYPHLLVFYRNCVEVVEIDPLQSNIRANWTYVTVRKPRHLNGAYFSTVCSSRLNILRVDGAAALQAVSGKGDDFSFTSSIIDMLQRSDEENDCETQTDSISCEASM